MEENEEVETFKKNMIDFNNKKVLDFGGNFGTLDMGFGNLLEHNNILPENYTCVDIDKQAMDKGRQKYPNAEWIYYNRYNPMYNPNGQKDLFPTINKKYDVIYSYSVFSHTSYKELLDFIQYFKTILTENGFMYLSVPCYEDKIIKWFYHKRIKDYGECDNIHMLPESYIYLVDNKIKDKIPEKCQHLVTIYNKDFLKTIGEIVTTNLPQSFLKIGYK